MKKGTAGFTLVELIVVIAILAILAGIAIPVYSGYIAKANEAADLEQLDSLKTAAVFAYTEAQVKAGKTDVEVTKISYTCEDAKIKTVTVQGSDKIDLDLTDAVKTLMGGNFPTLQSDTYKNGNAWNGTVWGATTPAPEDSTNP